MLHSITAIQHDPNGAVLSTLGLLPEWGRGWVVILFQPFWVSSAECNPEQEFMEHITCCNVRRYTCNTLCVPLLFQCNSGQYHSQVYFHL